MSGLADALLTVPPGLALILLFVLPAAEASMFVGLFFPGELVILLGGVLANQHRLPLWSVIVVGSAGAIAGDTIGYEVGRHFGDRFLAKLPKRLVKPEHVTRARDLLRNKGGRAVFIGRFTAALRALVPGLAGTSGLPYPTFLLFNVLGALAWVTVTAITGYVVGGSYRSAEHRLSLISCGILALVVVALAYNSARRSPRLRAWRRRRFALVYRVNTQLLALLAALGASTWLFAGISQDVVDHDGIALSDPRLLADVLSHRSGALTAVAKVVTLLGTDGVVYLLLAVSGVLVCRRTRRWQSLVLALAWLGAGQLVRLAINQAVGRPRPPHHLQLVTAHGYAFPSGHTTTATIGYGLLVGLAVILAPRSRRWAASTAIVLALAVGASRVYLGVHWPTDVLAGWSLGAAWLALGATIILSVRLIIKGRELRARRLVDLAEP